MRVLSPARYKDCRAMCIFSDCILHPCSMSRFLNTSLCICCLFTGDVSPISMSPISQSQFIPLGEILCLAISAMNSARKQVTQEALMEHLTTCFPGNRTLINHRLDGPMSVEEHLKNPQSLLPSYLFGFPERGSFCIQSVFLYSSG